MLGHGQCAREGQLSGTSDGIVKTLTVRLSASVAIVKVVCGGRVVSTDFGIEVMAVVEGAVGSAVV